MHANHLGTETIITLNVVELFELRFQVFSRIEEISEARATYGYQTINQTELDTLMRLREKLG
jgi:hypothetical protein